MIHAQNALLAQSRVDARGNANADGWGVAYYENGLPAIEKYATAASEDPRFSEAAGQVYARTVLAHIRRATVGGSSVVNTHPFSRGIWTFAHNGTVSGFDRVAPHLWQETDRRILASRRGSTDSELVFLWLLSRMARAGIDPGMRCHDLDSLVRVVAASVRYLSALCRYGEDSSPARLNFLLSDGEVMVATRWQSSLCWLDRNGVRDCAICGVPHVRLGDESGYRAVVVASEPISQERWREVPEASVLSVDRDLTVKVQPI